MVNISYHLYQSFIYLPTIGVYGIYIPDRALSNFELTNYAKQLDIPNFGGVFMRDELPKRPWLNECGIVNFNNSMEPGSHWVAYYNNKRQRIYFDSYGQVILAEVKDYLKSDKEKENDESVIQRNTDIVQEFNTQICGHLGMMPKFRPLLARI